MRVKLISVTPMFNKIITTANSMESTTGIIEVTKLPVDEIQTVVAVGSNVRDIKVGDLVCIDPSRYAVRKYAKNSAKSEIEEYANSVIDYQIPGVILDGIKHLMIMDSDVTFIIDKYVKEEEKTLINLESKLIA